LIGKTLVWANRHTHHATTLPAVETSPAEAEPAAANGHPAGGIGVLEKAVGILNLVSTANEPLTFTGLLKLAGLPRTTLHRTLATLCREGLLRHDPHTRTYRLGFRLLELAHEVWSGFDLRQSAQDEMIRLRNQTGETVVLAMLDGPTAILLAAEQSHRSAGLASRVGRRLPLHATALGKALLAYLDSGQRDALLAGIETTAFTARTLTDAAALRAALDLARSRGYALEMEEHEAGVSAVAAPVLDLEGRPIAALAITARSDHLGETRAHGLSASLIGAARAIAHNAGRQFMSIAPRAAPAGPSSAHVECVAEASALLGEGPVWSPRDSVLYWVDILGPSMHRFDTGSGRDTETRLSAMASVAIPKATGGMLLATPAGLVTWDPQDRSVRELCHPESDRPSNRYNDGKCDRMGRLWIGTLDMGSAPNRGSLYRVDPDGKWQRMDTGFSVCNGLGWSPDNRVFYFTDSARRTVYAYDFDLRRGTIANRRPLIVLDAQDGSPDGLTVDEDGCLWVAVWDAWRIARHAPDGRELLRVPMPVPRPTSCCFGGAGLDTLYVTSACVRLSEELLAAAPLSGSLFAVRVPGVRGLPENTFAG
jgi:sugar lactone lactonase YvrE/DNA-binding IclR family transcriptional regulator